MRPLAEVSKTRFRRWQTNYLGELVCSSFSLSIKVREEAGQVYLVKFARGAAFKKFV